MVVKRSCIPWALIAGVWVSLSALSAAQDDPSQRLLPLPQRELPGMSGQLELLRQLRSMLESAQNQPPQQTAESPSTGSSVTTSQAPNGESPLPNPAQFEGLRRILQNLKNQLPPGFVPPDLSSIPPDQIRDTLQKPEVQQKMRELLEDFSRDGLLPPPGQGQGPQLPLPDAQQLPRQSNEDSKKSPPQPRNNPSRPPAQPTNEIDESVDNQSTPQIPPSSMQSLHEFLKELAEKSGFASPKRPASTDEGNESLPENSTPPRTQGLSRNDPVPKELPGSQPQRSGPLRRRDRNSLTPDAGTAIPNRPGSFPDGIPAPDRRPGGDSTGQQSNPWADDAEAQQRVLESLQQLIQEFAEQSRPEKNSDQDVASRSQPAIPPGFPTTPEEDPIVRNGLQPNVPPGSAVPRSVPIPPSASPGPGGTGVPRPAPGATNNRQSQTSEQIGKLPSIREFLQEQLKNLQSSPQGIQGGNADSTARKPNVGPDEVPPMQDVRPAPQPAQPRGLSQMPSAPDQPPIDITKELQQRGFRDTLKKIVQEAQQKGLQPPVSKTDGGQQIAGDSPGQSGTSQTLNRSVMQFLDGLKDDITEIAKDAKFRDSPKPSPRKTFRPNPPERIRRQPSSGTMDSLRKAASDLFSDVSAKPKQSSAGNAAASGAGLSSPGERFDFTPVAILAGVVVATLVALLGLRFLNLRAASGTEGLCPLKPIQPHEIQNRADLVRAFHEFALRSARSVESWWTHRTVKEVLAAEIPEKSTALQSLTDAYELARYRPQNHELSADEIQSARAALRECTVGARG